MRSALSLHLEVSFVPHLFVILDGKCSKLIGTIKGLNWGAVIKNEFNNIFNVCDKLKDIINYTYIQIVLTWN